MQYGPEWLPKRLHTQPPPHCIELVQLLDAAPGGTCPEAVRQGTVPPGAGGVGGVGGVGGEGGGGGVGVVGGSSMQFG